jgi:cysteinyl-tRNA synthetase
MKGEISGDLAASDAQECRLGIPQGAMIRANTLIWPISSQHWIIFGTLLAAVFLLACSGSGGNHDQDDGAGQTPAATHAIIDLPTSTSVSTTIPPESGSPTADPQERLLSVNDFLYQLQDYDLEAMRNSAYDLIVMDYSADGTGDEEFSRELIEALKHSPGGAKIVLGYISIGEAEEYRYYWQPAWKTGHPEWLDQPNPDWTGNYKVRYWDPEWQAIVFAYVDRLVDAGFDGAYLDIIDGYEYFGDQGRGTAAQDMADFVAAIAAHARARNRDFYIFPQNGSELASLAPGYLDHVDGIGQEDIYYGYDDDDRATPPDVTAETEEFLDLFRAAGKLVLTVDYATTAANVDEAYARSRARGYIPFVSQRDLDHLTINPGHEPD